MKTGVSPPFIAEQWFLKLENSSKPLFRLLQWRGEKGKQRAAASFRSNYESFPDLSACYLGRNVRGCSACSRAPFPDLELRFPIP